MAKKASISLKLDAQITGNIGLYFTCYHLSRLGWNVMPTVRNARGVDAVAYSRDATRFVSLQIKTLSKRVPVPLGKSLDKVMGDFWIVVNKVVTDEPEVFVMLPKEIRKLAHRGEKGGRVSFWLQPKAYDCDKFRDAWDRIGRGDDN